MVEKCEACHQPARGYNDLLACYECQKLICEVCRAYGHDCEEGEVL